MRQDTIDTVAGMRKINDDFYFDKSAKLGSGNFGVVYKGYHLSAHQIIAVKFVDKKILNKNPDHEREIAVMQDLSKINHPNIMGYYGSEKLPEGLYCFIELCNGGSLKKRLSQKLSQLKVLSLFKQMIDGMSYMNAQKKVHRDLKPDNILLDQNGELKIADFGLARDLETMMTKGVCTPLYAAPEVINLLPYNQKCDVWSAGLIIYEMLTGYQLFKEIKTKQQLLRELAKFEKQPNSVKVKQEFHPTWTKIINMMLTHSIEKRPTFKELKEFFESIEEKMRNDLIEKYGEEETSDDNLRLTKTISPYQKKEATNKNYLQEMALKLDEEKSFTSLNDARKWLNFSRQKAEFMVKLIKQFNTCQYGYIKNVQKYLLMFLSVGSYIARMENLKTQIKAKKIKTQEALIQEGDVPKHKSEFNELLSQILGKLTSSIERYKGVLEKQIIPKILGTYMQRPEEKQIIMEQQNLVDLLNEGKSGKYRDEGVYANLFSQIANAPKVLFSLNTLKDFKYEEIKVYTYIRLIVKLNVAFSNTNFRNEDYLRLKKQQIQNASKEELCDFANKLNN